MYIPVEDWFLAFVLTVAVEAGVVWLLLRRRVAGLPRLGVLVLGANLATHPVVWFVLTPSLKGRTPLLPLKKSQRKQGRTRTLPEGTQLGPTVSEK